MDVAMDARRGSCDGTCRVTTITPFKRTTTSPAPSRWTTTGDALYRQNIQVASERAERPACGNQMEAASGLFAGSCKVAPGRRIRLQHESLTTWRTRNSGIGPSPPLTVKPAYQRSNARERLDQTDAPEATVR